MIPVHATYEYHTAVLSLSTYNIKINKLNGEVSITLLSSERSVATCCIRTATGIRDVSHSSRLNVSDDKILDSFVLGGTVGAAHVLAVATALLGASVASSFQSPDGSASDQKRVTVLNLTVRADRKVKFILDSVTVIVR